MINAIVIEDATNLAINILEAKSITETTNTIRNRILAWYNNSDICDAETLAVCAILGDYNSTLSYDDILTEKNTHFPSFNPYDGYEYAIWEIEEAQYDMFL